MMTDKEIDEYLALARKYDRTPEEEARYINHQRRNTYGYSVEKSDELSKANDPRYIVVNMFGETVYDALGYGFKSEISARRYMFKKIHEENP